MTIINKNKKLWNRGDEGNSNSDNTLVGARLPLSKEVDALLTNELSSMSLKERENILHEIHGVDDIVEENDELVEAKLSELNKRLDEYESQQSTSEDDNVDDPLYHVLRHSPNYVKDVKFLKMFLRSVKWDVKQALQRLQLFFIEKQRLFGLDSLGRDITLTEDLNNDDDLQAFHTGYTQMLPGRDNAGRAIWLSLTHMRDAIINKKCIARTWFYNLMSALEDEETQIKGVCNVKYDYGRIADDDGDSSTTTISKLAGGYASNEVESRITHHHQQQNNGQGEVVVYDDVEHYKQMQRLFDAIPLRLCAIHVCYINPNMLKLFSIAAANVSKSSRARIRFHYGNHMECQYELMTFGIIPQLLPIDMNGTVTLDRHNNWIHCRKLLEEQQMLTMKKEEKETKNSTIQDDDPSPQPILSISSGNGSGGSSVDGEASALTVADRQAGMIVNVPNKMDVLMGRGNLGHFGNIRFRTLIDENIHEYETAHRMGKTLLSGKIVKRIKGESITGDDNVAGTSAGVGGGRFLKRGKGCWIVMTDEEAREKVSHRFRNLRNKGGGGGGAINGSGCPSVSVKSTGNKASMGNKRSRGGQQLQQPPAAIPSGSTLPILEDSVTSTTVTSNSGNELQDNDPLGFHFLDDNNDVNKGGDVSILSVGGIGSSYSNTNLFQSYDAIIPDDSDNGGCFGNMNLTSSNNGSSSKSKLQRTDQQTLSSLLGNAFW